MPQHVAVVFVHGIQAENLNFADGMKAKLRGKIPRKLREYVEFQSVFWAGTVRAQQQRFMDRAANDYDIDPSQMRRFFVEGLGDAAAYQKTRSRRNSAYYAIQDCITSTLSQLELSHPDRPVIFVGHSLGCHIISSYAWDLNWLKQKTPEEIEAEGDPELKKLALELRDASPLRRLDTFAGFVTMGSNMPLFTFTFGPERVYPITSIRPDMERMGVTPAFPGRGLAPGVAAKARWLNFFSKHDLLGFPLKSLNNAYRNEARLLDIPVRSESWFSALSPTYRFVSAHSGYWTNSTVVRETANLIQAIIEAPGAAQAAEPGARAAAE